MKKILLFVLLYFSVVVACSQRVEATWESINERGYPQWFSEAKLGIFVHWGLYSVPAYCSREGYSEWLLRGLMVGDSLRTSFLRRSYGDGFSYRDLPTLFKGELFDPDEWVDIFARSGAKYVVLVSKHHDGYCLWDSRYAAEWNSVVSGPKRDIVAELTASVQAAGLRMGLYFSLPEWGHPLHNWSFDPHEDIGEYVDKHLIPQFKELVQKYRPVVLFTDGEWFNTAEQWHATELIAWYYNTVGREAIVNDRWGHGCQHGFKTPEYSGGIVDTVVPWAECRGLGRSFGLNRNEPLSNYLTSDMLIRHFVKLVAAGGGMTLNVGPAADGQIPLLQQERLLDLGKWLNINGEAIYKSRPFDKHYEYKNVVVKRVDADLNFNWVRNSPDERLSYDNFNACWEGFLVPDFSEEYTFTMTVDDDASVTIDGVPLFVAGADIDAEAQKNVPEAENYIVRTKTMKMEAGKKYKITVNYHENDLEARLRLFWESASQPKACIGTHNYLLPDGSGKHGLAATYTCQQPKVCYTTNNGNLYAIAIDYPQDSLVLNIEPRANILTISMLGCDKNLDWHYSDGKLIIDTRKIKYADITSSAAWTFKIENYFK